MEDIITCEQEKIQLFENQKIRTAWDSEKEEGNELVTNCHQLKLNIADRKRISDGT